MVKYIGSKRLLAPLIAQLAGQLPIASACDLFAGTTRVGQALRRAGLVVHSNDLASYSEVLGQAYIAADDRVDRPRLRELLAHLAALPPLRGYFTETFCLASRYLQPHNGMRVDAIREEIERLALPPCERALALASLLEAADRVDSTCGLQMAFIKQWSPRSYNELELREPAAVAGPAGRVSRTDANELAPLLEGVDCAYLDPPYNQHSYFSNYHVWETLVRWDRPETYGIAHKRVDCQTTKSPYNSKRQAWEALSHLVESLPTPWIIVSFSNEGFHELSLLAALLAEKGYVRSLSLASKRYVGAQIGIYSPTGEKVGRVSHLRNTETLFLVGPEERLVEAAAAQVGRSLPASAASRPHRSAAEAAPPLAPR